MKLGTNAIRLRPVATLFSVIAFALIGLGAAVGPAGCNREPEVKQTPVDPKAVPPYAGQTTNGNHK